MTFVVEKDVPIPKSPRRSKYPFREMAVGDSFFLPNRNNKQIAGLQGMAFKQTGFRFRIQREGTGWRMWRIS